MLFFKFFFLLISLKNKKFKIILNWRMVKHYINYFQKIFQKYYNFILKKVYFKNNILFFNHLIF